MTESTERPLYTIMGLIITIGIAALVLYIYFTQRSLGSFTDTRQSQELTKLLSGILAVCGNSNHPQVNNLYVTVFGGYEIQYHMVIGDFGSKKEKNLKEYGCNKNCLCAFKDDRVIQCVSMFNQENPNCQDLNIQEDHLLGDQDLAIPWSDPITGLPRSSCQFRLNLKWDGTSSPKRVVLEKKEVQKLTYTTSSFMWSDLADDICVF